MKRRAAWILCGLGVAGGMAACVNHVDIQKESGGTTASSTSSSTMTQGSGGSTPGSGKMVTAETDIGQYQSITVPGAPTSVKVVGGPFFVSDVYMSGNGGNLSTVSGGDCSVSQEQHTTVLSVTHSVPQFHGLRLPVLSNQTLCWNGSGFTVVVLGFKPY